VFEFQTDLALDEVIRFELILVHLNLGLMLADIRLTSVHELLDLFDVSYELNLILEIFHQLLSFVPESSLLVEDKRLNFGKELFDAQV